MIYIIVICFIKAICQRLVSLRSLYYDFEIHFNMMLLCISFKSGSCYKENGYSGLN